MKIYDKLFAIGFWRWTLIGPLILLLTTISILIKPTPYHFELACLILMGFSLCARWKIPGFIFSFLLLSMITLLHHDKLFGKEFLWEISLNSSIILGFLITALSLEEAKTIFHEHTQQLARSHAGEIEKLKEEFHHRNEQQAAQTLDYQISLDQLKNYHESSIGGLAQLQLQLSACEQQEQAANHLVHILKQDQLTYQLEIEKVNKSLNEELRKTENLKKSCDDFKNQMALLAQNFQQQASQHQVALETNQQQMHLLQEENKRLTEELTSLTTSLTKERDKSFSLETKEPLDRLNWQETRRYEGLYTQMRTQFEEKSKILDKTRQALFHAQEQVENLQRLQVEKQAEIFEEEMKRCECYIAHIEQVYTQQEDRLQKEIENLEQLISHLS